MNYMVKKIIKQTLPLCLAAFLCMAFLGSCENDKTGGTSSPSSQSLVGDVISNGTCEAFGVITEDSRMCYIKSMDTYYIDYFYNDNGSFGFKWNRETNVISLVESNTGLVNGYYPIYFLDQKKYDNELGDKAVPSSYDPDSDIFTFNILYETAIDDGHVFRETATVTYKPKSAQPK